LKAKRISANLNAVFGEMDIEDLWLPYFCVSTNLTKSRLEVHRRGELATAIRASIAIPGVLPPVPYGEDLLVDGGVLDNVPADVMRLDPSIGTVIASDVAPKQGPGTAVDYGMYLSGWDAAKNAVLRRSSPYPGLGAVLVRTMVTSSEGRRAAMREDGTTDLYLDLDIPGVGMLEFDKLHSTVEAGYRNARPRLEAWLASRPS
jgi:predicted acylesterase/phospholipase RssA